MWFKLAFLGAVFMLGPILSPMKKATIITPTNMNIFLELFLCVLLSKGGAGSSAVRLDDTMVASSEVVAWIAVVVFWEVINDTLSKSRNSRMLCVRLFALGAIARFTT